MKASAKSIMGTKSCPNRLVNVFAAATLLLLSGAIYPSRGMDRFVPLANTQQSAGAPAIETRPGPQPPCGNEPVPAYPDLDEPANVKSWSAADLGGDWMPPACTGWNARGFTTLVTTVARFRYSAGAEGLLRHIGAISELVGVRYWSTTHKRWQTLILDAHALNDQQSSQRRGDFMPDELKQGAVFYFDQTDNL